MAKSTPVADALAPVIESYRAKRAVLDAEFKAALSDTIAPFKAAPMLAFLYGGKPVIGNVVASVPDGVIFTTSDGATYKMDPKRISCFADAPEAAEFKAAGEAFAAQKAAESASETEDDGEDSEDDGETEDSE